MVRRPLTATCGTDDASQQRYCDAMTGAGFDVTEIIHSYTGELDLDHMVGGIRLCAGRPEAAIARPAGGLRRRDRPGCGASRALHRARPGAHPGRTNPG